MIEWKLRVQGDPVLERVSLPVSFPDADLDKEIGALTGTLLAFQIGRAHV